jgi:FtsH-binding integral membrane protein
MRRFADSMTWAEDRGGFAISAALDARMAFVRKTYAHLLGELTGVAAIVAVGIRVQALQDVGFALMSRWYLYLIAFFGVSFLARAMLQGKRSMGVQYAAAALWVTFLGLLVTPLAVIAQKLTGSYAVLGEAGVLTGCAFAGITAYVFYTKKDFSFIGGALWMMTWVLFGIGMLAWIFGGLGGSGTASLLYSCAMVLLLGGWVLYDTSKVLHRRHVSQYVAASVDLLVDFVYMFIYILSILLNSRR